LQEAYTEDELGKFFEAKHLLQPRRYQVGNSAIMPGENESVASWMHIPGEDTRTGNTVNRHVKLEFITSNSPVILFGKNLQN
jgi:hypothetical protein